MAKFKCIRSGNFITLTNENDIEGVRLHEGYVEVFDEPEKPEEPEIEIPNFLMIQDETPQPNKEYNKRRGRPPRNNPRY